MKIVVLTAGKTEKEQVTKICRDAEYLWGKEIVVCSVENLSRHPDSSAIIMAESDMPTADFFDKCINKGIPVFRYAENESGRRHFMYADRRYANIAGIAFNGMYFPYFTHSPADVSSESSPFGFRLPFGYKKHDGKGKLIALFGGAKCYDPSRAYGGRFSDILETRLNENGKHSYTVLNFGLSNSVITDRIMIYLLFAHDLKPDIVASCGMADDLEAAAFCDRHMIMKDAILYPESARLAADILHAGGDKGRLRNGLGSAELRNAYEVRKQQFENMVQGNGGKFISIQDNETDVDCLYARLKTAFGDF
jgi:hypothetical protein